MVEKNQFKVFYSLSIIREVKGSVNKYISIYTSLKNNRPNSVFKVVAKGRLVVKTKNLEEAINHYNLIKL